MEVFRDCRLSNLRKGLYLKFCKAVHAFLSVRFPFQTRLIRVTGPREADPCLRNFILRASATGPPPVAIAN